MGKKLVIKGADFSQNTVTLTKSDFTIIDGVFFSAGNGTTAVNSSVKLSEGYYHITQPCSIKVTANENKSAHVMLLSTIKQSYQNGETLPVVNEQMIFISKNTNGTLTASGDCYLCVAEYNTIDNYSWPDTIRVIY